MGVTKLLEEKYPAFIKPFRPQPQNKHCTCGLAVVVAVAAIISGSGSLLIWSRDHSAGSENEQQVFSIADSYQPKHSTLPSKTAELN